MLIKKNYFKYIILGTIVFSFLINGIAFPFLDETIAIHFDMNGNVNGEFNKIIIFLLPILMLLILFVKDNQGNRLFMGSSNIITEPYKVLLCVVGAFICFFSNLYIVLFNLKMTTVSSYYFLQLLIMLLIVLILSCIIYKKNDSTNYDKVILLSIIICFVMQIISIFYKHEILDWLSSIAILLGTIIAIFKYGKDK